MPNIKEMLSRLTDEEKAELLKELNNSEPNKAEPEPEKPEQEKDDSVEDKTVEKTDPNPEPTPEPEPEPEPTPTVSGETTGGNAMRVEDLVSRDELMEKLGALSAKLDAVISENTEIKKYKGDFGNITAKKEKSKDDVANETFESYSAKFKK